MSRARFAGSRAATARDARAMSLPLVLLDLATTLSAGAGGDTDTRGYSTASLSLSASIDRAAAPVLERGLHSDASDGPMTVWVLTGLEPDDRDRAGIRIDGTVRAGDARTSWIDGQAWARGWGGELDISAALQPVGSLRDWFWHSGRDVAVTGLVVDLPPLAALGDFASQLELGRLSLVADRRSALGDSGTGGWDVAVDMAFGRIHWRHKLTLELLRAYAREADIFGLDAASTFGVDLASATWRQSGLEVFARVGLANETPAIPLSVEAGPQAAVPTYWLELRMPRATIGAGSWERIDPSGHAVDAGQVASAKTGWQRGRYQLGGELQVGRLRRVLLGKLAPADLAPEGTRMWMGRGSALAAVRVTRALALTASLWHERSDRDDPRWAVPASGALATHAGAELTAGWQLRAL
jgi:hypothetical protein